MNQYHRAAAIIIQHNHILLAKSKGYAVYWEPGGGIEAGESPLQALHREIKEELGVFIQKATPFKIYTDPSPFKPNTLTHTHCFIVNINEIPKAKAEIEKLAWVNSKNISNIPHLPFTENLLNDLKKEKLL